MIGRALPALAGFLGLCISLSAQEINRAGESQVALFAVDFPRERGAAETPWPFAQVDTLRGLNGSFVRLPSLLLSDRPLTSAFNRLETIQPYFLPAVSAGRAESLNGSIARRSEGSDHLDDWRRSLGQASGEVGVFYGKSSGKFGREDKQGYIIGDVGDDRIHITVGMSYEESTGRNLRFRR